MGTLFLRDADFPGASDREMDRHAIAAQRSDTSGVDLGRWDSSGK